MSDVLGQLRDVVDALTNPSQHRTPRHTWPADRRKRHKVKLADHVTIVPGLLTQLAAMAFPLGAGGDDGGGARAVPQSRPPGNPRAIAAYLDIHAAADRWSADLGCSPRATLASTVRGMLGAAPAQPHDVQRRLLRDLDEWLAQCMVITGVAVPDPVLAVPCPADLCGARTLRVDLDKGTVRCLSCGARWARDEGERVGSLGVLARYVTEYQSAARTAADRVRAESRRRKAALYGDPDWG